MTCNYSTPYPIPESTEYYLYDGINFSLNIYHELTDDTVFLLNAQLTTASSTSLFTGFFGSSSACVNAWLNRCTHNFDQNPSGFSVTLSAFDSSRDQTEFVINIATTTGSDSCTVALTGTTL